MKILVTGASGLLGREVFSRFQKDDSCSVVGVVHSRCRPGCVALDLTDSAAVLDFLQREDPDVILHTAAERHPDLCAGDRSRTEALNVTACGVLAQWVKDQIRPHLLVSISTDYLFDGSHPPYSPDDPPNPLNLYGMSKWRGERAIQARLSSRYMILRVPILYGPTENLAESAVTVLAQQMLDAKEDNQKTIRLDHWAVRYPTYTPDVAKVLHSMVERWVDKPSLSGIFHWSGREPFTKYEMACVMAAQMGFDQTRLIPVSQPPSDGVKRPQNAHLDIAALERMGISSHTPFAEACAMLLSEWIK